MNEFHVDMNAYLPLRDVVFNTLRQAILTGELQPGERLMEISLANRLGVSRTPVREAIHKLEQEGLVIMMPRRGAQVAQITQKDLVEVLEVRLGLEEMAVSFACDRMTGEQFTAICQAAEEFTRAIDGNDLTLLAQADENFHSLICTAAGNDCLCNITNNLREQMYRYRIEHLKNPEVRRDLDAEHKSICHALEAKDAQIACKVLRSHIQSQRQAIIQMLQGKN
jgi:DNA-binding GntR family transcriptional regulator